MTANASENVRKEELCPLWVGVQNGPGVRALLWVSLKVSTVLLLDIEPTSPISCSILKMFVHLFSLLLQPQHLGTGITEDSQDLIIGNGI